MSRPKGIKNKKRGWALLHYTEAARRFGSYEIQNGRRRRMYDISKDALKQARYRVAREERAQKAAARAWARKEGIDFDKLSPTLKWGLAHLVDVLPLEQDNPDYMAGLRELARKIRTGEL
jgi:hypothetical protein